jgi:hypothetical protein
MSWRFVKSHLIPPLNMLLHESMLSWRVVEAVAETLFGCGCSWRDKMSRQEEVALDPSDVDEEV